MIKKRVLTTITTLLAIPTTIAVEDSVYENLTQALLNILQTIASFGGALTRFSEVDKNMVWFFSITIGIIVFTILYWSIIQHGNFLGNAEQRRRPALIISLLGGIGATLLIPTATYEQVLFFIKNGLVQLAIGLAIPAGAYAAYRAMSQRMEDWGIIGFARILLGIAIAGGNTFLDKFTTTFQGTTGEVMSDKLIVGALPWIGTLSAILSIITIGLFINGIYRIVTDIIPEGTRRRIREEAGWRGIERARTQEQRRGVLTGVQRFQTFEQELRRHSALGGIIETITNNYTNNDITGRGNNIPQGLINSLQNLPPRNRMTSAAAVLRRSAEQSNAIVELTIQAADTIFHTGTLSGKGRRIGNNLRNIRDILRSQSRGTWWAATTPAERRAEFQTLRTSVDQTLRNIASAINSAQRLEAAAARGTGTP